MTQSTIESELPTSDTILVSAAQYTIDQLADIYNQARVDYIVPMPMNGKRMMEYVQHYDIDLEASAVALNNDKQPCGIIMMGVRDERAWTTRLGVIPDRRKHHMGQFMMEALIAQAQQRRLRRVQLEVIQGNMPAHKLFLKLGFVPVRDLMVIRRPPGKLAAELGAQTATISEIPSADLPAYLAHRANTAAWTEETPSLLHAGNLQGLSVSLHSGESGWIIFQRLAFQLTHFVLAPNISRDLAQALLYNVHTKFPMFDTKIENVPTTDEGWPAYQALGYLEAFSRIEMYLTL